MKLTANSSHSKSNVINVIHVQKTESGLSGIIRITLFFFEFRLMPLKDRYDTLNMTKINEIIQLHRDAISSQDLNNCLKLAKDKGNQS